MSCRHDEKSMRAGQNMQHSGLFSLNMASEKTGLASLVEYLKIVKWDPDPREDLSHFRCTHGKKGSGKKCLIY